MAGWVKAPTGATVYQDAGGMVHLKGVNGDVQAVPAAHAAELLGDKYSGFAPASADDINAAHDAAHTAATEAKTSTLGAFGRGVATGAVNAALAVPKLVTGLGAAAIGKEDPLASYSGSGLVQDVGTAARHLGGESIGKAEDESREQMLADREAHGFAHGAGELAGTVAAGAPMGGLAGGLAKAGAARLGLAGARAALAAGAGASVLEGAALGSTVGSEEAWLKGQPAATAEQTLAGIGMGGLFGLGAGVAVHGLGPAVAKYLGRGATEAEGVGALEAAEAGTAEAAAVPGRATTAIDETVAPAALDSVPTKQVRAARGWLSGVSDEAAVKQVFHDQKPALRALGNGKAPTPELLADAGQFFNESGISGFRSDSAALERATEVSQSAGQRIGTIMEHLDARAPYVEARPLVAKLQDFAADLRTASWTPEQDAIAKKIAERTVKLQELADAGIVTHSDLWNYRKGLDTLSGWGKTAPNATKEAMRELRGMVETQIEQSVASGGGADLGSEYFQAKRAYRFGTAAKDALEERVGVRDISNNLFGLKDTAIGAATLLGTGGAALPALGAAIGTKLIRERGWGALASLARKAAGDAVDLSAAPVGALRTARNIQAMVAHSESHIGESIGKFLDVGGVGGIVARSAARSSTAAALRSNDLPSAQRAYQDHAREVQTIASVPDVAASRLSGITGQTLPTVAPGLNAEMAAVGLRGAQYLKANMPCPPSDPDSITPQLESPPPAARSDLHIYANRVEGVEDPLSLLDDLNRGRVSPEKVEAVKAVWPLLFMRMRQATFASLAERKEKVPYHKRQLLDMTLDGGGALEPSYRTASLSIMKQANEFQEKQLKEKAPRPASGGSPKAGNMLQTSADRIASR